MPTSLAKLLCLCGLLGAGVASAEPYIEHLEPASLARGQNNRLAIVGTQVDRPVGLWHSLPPGQLAVTPVVGATPERAEFEIDVAADCPLGIYGLRIATEDGLSNLHLFVVDDLLPRGALDKPQQAFPVAVAGEFKPAGVDRYPIRVTAGQRLSFDVIASRLGTDADPLVTIVDAAGRQVVQHDNDPGLFFDCCFEHKFELAGDYAVEVRDARFEGSPHWRYVLRIGQFPAAKVALPSSVRPGEQTLLRFPELPEAASLVQLPADQVVGPFFQTVRRPTDQAGNWILLTASDLRSVVEVEPNDKLDQATPSGETLLSLHGVLQTPGDRDFFLLDLKMGERLTFKAETRGINSAADLEIALFDSTGRELTRNDEVNLPNNVVDEATLNFNVGQAGPYRLMVREATDQGGPQFTYRVDVRHVAPKIQLTAPVSSYTVPQQSYQRLGVSVVRTDFNGPLELSLLGAPPGVKLEPHVIPEGEQSLACRITAGADAPLGIHTFQIIARGQIAGPMGDVKVETVAVVQPMVDRQYINVDLIKYALRDNQRFLPPSVTTQLALQVTPPSPVTVDIADTPVILPRYQQTALTIHTTRQPGCDAPITFVAAGGQLGEESQGRRQVFARIPAATPATPDVVATIHSRSLANDNKEPVDLTATVQVGTRTITLVRSFLLEVRPAFHVTFADPMLQTLPPGATGQLTFNLTRMPTFAGPVTLTLQPNFDLPFPETLTIAADQTTLSIPLPIPPETKPGRRRLRLQPAGQVGNFQEEPRTLEIDIEVKAEEKK